MPTDNSRSSGPQLQESGKQTLTDRKFSAHQDNVAFKNYLFVRVVAKEVNFTKVDFSYSTFDAAYFRKCRFDSCKFTGCRFTNSNLLGSAFEGCDFSYAVFDRTVLNLTDIQSNMPGYENVALRFARSLRVNFQQIGDVDGVNKCIEMELQSTYVHLWKAAWSRKAITGKSMPGITAHCGRALGRVLYS